MHLRSRSALPIWGTGSKSSCSRSPGSKPAAENSFEYLGGSPADCGATSSRAGCCCSTAAIPVSFRRSWREDCSSWDSSSWCTRSCRRPESQTFTAGNLRLRLFLQALHEIAGCHAADHHQQAEPTERGQLLTEEQ